MIRSILAGLSAATLAAAPIAASAAPANPAASLSLGSGARVSTESGHHDQLLGGAGLIGLLVVGGVAAILAVGLTNDGNNPGTPASR